jgi:enoyl-CoA hydratase/carnithine racemase
MGVANRSYESLLIKQIGRVVRVTLNRPERRNAISSIMRMGGTPPTSMWIYNLGPQWAKRLLFTGDTLYRPPC